MQTKSIMVSLLVGTLVMPQLAIKAESDPQPAKAATTNAVSTILSSNTIINATNQTTDATVKKKEMQVIKSDPLNYSLKIVPGNLDISRYKFHTAQPQPEWYEWIKPKLFLTRWIEMWTTETNTSAVALLSIKF